MKKFVLGLAAIALAASAVPAAATVFTFTFTGGVNAVFQIDDAGFVPTPRTDDSFATMQWVRYNGGPSELNELDFYLQSADGGVDIHPTTFSPNEYGGYSPTGHQLFGGSVEAPTFFAGGFDLYDYFYPDTVAYHLEIAVSAPPGPVPEPATWAMMISGFGLVGGAMRRRPGRLRQAG